MPDTGIIIAVAILFPLFGALVFFYWRTQYGVGVPWLTDRRKSERENDADIVVTRFQRDPESTPRPPEREGGPTRS